MFIRLATGHRKMSFYYFVRFKRAMPCLFLSIFVFCKWLTVNKCSLQKMLMAGFQPGSRYCVGSDHSATTNVQFLIFLIAYFFYKGNINVWAFSKVYYIPLRPCLQNY